MRPSLNNFIESAQNPKACLKNIKNVIPIRNGRGEPVFSVSEYTIKFQVEIDGRRCRLICLTVNSPLLKSRLWQFVSRPEIVASPFIATCHVYLHEMLVFHDNGTSDWYDVVVQEVPKGKTIDEFLIDCGERNDTKSPREALKSLAELSEWLYDRRAIHQNMQLPYIIVRPDNSLTLINLEMGRVLTPREFADDRRARDRDNLSIGYLAVILYLSTCTPKTYTLLRQGILRRLPDLKKILPSIARAAEIMEMEALSRLIKRLHASNGRLPDREKLNRDLRALIDQLPKKDLNTMALTYFPLRHHKAQSLREMTQSKKSGIPCSGSFDWMALPSDTLVRVESENKYFYVDIDGNRINDLSYDYAYDFAEGRAVVINGNDYALIDREGNLIVPFICEDMEWDPENGVAVAMIDGKWGAFDRSGNLLIPMNYDWLGQFSHDLVVAQLNDRYGYLRRDGSVAIPFIYEDAYCFAHNAAMVELGAERFLIDLDGNRISEQFENEHRQVAMGMGSVKT